MRNCGRSSGLCPEFIRFWVFAGGTRGKDLKISLGFTLKWINGGGVLLL